MPVTFSGPIARAARKADSALSMAKMHREFLLEEFPEFTDKNHLFLNFAQNDERDVEDPIGKSDEIYRICCDEIDKALDAILERHAPTSN